MQGLIRHLLLFPAIILAGSLLGGCGYDEPQPVHTEPQSDAVRSVLVYMVANNSLGGSSGNGYDESDLKEMDAAAKAGAFGANRLIVYHHAYHSDPKLIEITAAGRQELKFYDTSESSVSAARMEQVISDFKSLVPAERHGIVLWSHASGWLENGIEEDVAEANGKLRAFGVDGARQMNVTTLARVLDGEGFDFVYFDCCHMAGVEVAYQLRYVTPFIVGSASELPAQGMPYDKTLPYLMADEADPVGAAAQTFAYYDGLTGWGRTCTISVIDTSELDALADAVGEFYSLHPQLSADYRGQEFIASRCRYFDLSHYLGGLAQADMGGGFMTAYANALSAIDKAVVFERATPYLWYGLPEQVDINNHCGSSTYIMKSEQDADAGRLNYRNLDWWKHVASRLW